MLSTSAFPVSACSWLTKVAWIMLLPSYCIFSSSVALINPTTTEAKRYWLLKLGVGLPCHAFLLILLSPLTLVALPLWWIMRLCKRKYIFSYTPIPDGPIGEPNPLQRVVIATANVCLLHDPFARFNNLKDKRKRAVEIGRRIIESQSPMSAVDSATRYQSASETSAPPVDEKHILSHFPSHMDILCFQEVFDRDAMLALKTQLHKIFPYIVYDVGVNSWRSNKYLINSGLLLASRYPPLEVCFKSFGAKCGVDSMASKGLLMVKLDLGAVTNSISQTPQRRVCYVFNTHLQAKQPVGSTVRKCQLTCAKEWAQEFRVSTFRPEEEILVFDVFCGDLNVDTISARDASDRNHPCLTVDYIDPCCRIHSPNLEELDWVIGTSLKHERLHDPEISTPEKLHAVLSDPELRAKYVDGAIKEDGTVAAGKRRLDYILFSRQLVEQHRILVDNVSFVAEFAGLTDHLPVVAAFQCSTSSKYVAQTVAMQHV